MSLTYISDHLTLALDRIIIQYKGKPRIVGVLTALADQIQQLEDAFKQLFEDRQIETAEGVQLDGVGDIVGIPRILGQTDEDYLFEIKTKIIQNLNEGTPEEFIAAAQFFLDVDLVYYNEVYPCEVALFSSTPVDEADRAIIKLKLGSFLPATVSLGFFGHADADNPFRFDTGVGFGDTNDANVGDLLADLY